MIENTWALPYMRGRRLVRPAAGRVLARARALAAVVLRAQIEAMASGPERWERHEELVRRLEEGGLMRRLEPRELVVVLAPPGRLSVQDHVDASWRAEGLALLGWALGLVRLPPERELARVERVLEDVQNPGVRPRLRNSGELDRVALRLRRAQALLVRARVVEPVQRRILDRRLSVVLERRRAAEWLVGAGHEYAAISVASP